MATTRTGRAAIDVPIVDDHRPAQYSMWTVLSWKRDIRVIGVANGNAEAMTAATRGGRTPA